ncbi:MAG: radical SAM protein [Chloroflexota bacterium]
MNDVDVRHYPLSPAVAVRPQPSSNLFVYGQAPRLVLWEATRCCDLVCVHCRVAPVIHRHPLELHTQEAKALFRQLLRFEVNEPPRLVITGGDPIFRPDLVELVAYANHLGLHISVATSGTPSLTADYVTRLKEAGLNSLELGLDGSTAASHDAFRGAAGSFQWTMEGLEAAQAADIPIQINTLVARQNLADLPRLYELAQVVGASRWALFFLVPIGWSQVLDEITAEQSEQFLASLWRLTSQTPLAVTATEAPHYFRIAYDQMRAAGMSETAILDTPLSRGFGTREGNGTIFVSHTGQVYPSGWLPLPAGNVRRESLVSLYRDSAFLQSLRNVDRLWGRCGRCPYKAICGGSRARAYAISGDPFASDDLCPYQPPDSLKREA